MVDTHTPEPGHCVNSTHCHAADPTTKRGYSTSDPLCPACLTTAERDIRGLVYDYLDLAQLQEPTMSQAVTEHTSGGDPEAPMPLAGHTEALQAEIVHATAVWEYELRVAYRLSDPRTFAPLWRRTVYDQLELKGGARQTRPARSGALVQRAVNTIAVRLGRLAALPATLVCPTGIEDEPVELTGWEAIHHLQHLHQRARAALGRTTRKFWISGACWQCTARPVDGTDGPLWRSEPKRAEDPMEVHCATCGAARPYPDYERYMTQLEWPEVEAAA